MCFTGLRISDFKQLTKNNIQESSLVLIPHETLKKNKEIVIPLIDIAKQLIKDENSQIDILFDVYVYRKMNEYQKKMPIMPE